MHRDFGHLKPHLYCQIQNFYIVSPAANPLTAEDRCNNRLAKQLEPAGLPDTEFLHQKPSREPSDG